MESFVVCFWLFFLFLLEFRWILIYFFFRFFFLDFGDLSVLDFRELIDVRMVGLVLRSGLVILFGFFILFCWSIFVYLVLFIVFVFLGMLFVFRDVLGVFLEAGFFLGFRGFLVFVFDSEFLSFFIFCFRDSFRLSLCKIFFFVGLLFLNILFIFVFFLVFVLFFCFFWLV